MYREFLKLKPDYSYTGRTDLVTRLAQDCYQGSKSRKLNELEKNRPAKAVFLFLVKRVVFAEEASQQESSIFENIEISLFFYPLVIVSTSPYNTYRHKLSYVSERKSELLKAQQRKMDASSPDSAPMKQGLMDFILLAMKVDDGFVPRGRIPGA